MKIKVVIIEDEFTAQRHLIKLLNASDDMFLVIKTLSTVIDSVYYLRNESQPDLIFMDIHLSDGISFDILEKIDIRCPIIFTTAYDQYAIKAFKTSGIGYLLKPITKDDLDVSIQKYHTLSNSPEELLLKSLELINLYKHEIKPNYTERFLLKTGIHLTPVKTNDVAYFYRDGIVFAKDFNEKSFPMDESLNKLQTVLNPTQFFRLNRQLLININAIKKLTTYKPGQLIVEIEPKFHEKIHLSQERSSLLKVFLNSK